MIVGNINLQETHGDTTELIYFIDVTEPLQVPGAVIQEVPVEVVGE